MDILIVEDELLIGKSLKKLLEKRSATVTLVTSGKMAIDLILTHNYDRIICDLMLQDITGFDVIEESKRRFSLEQIKLKFIIMTAYSSENVLAKASQYGCNILRKPFDDLQETLQSILTIQENDETNE